MAQRPHRADEIAEARIASAVSFVAHFRKSPREEFRADADSLGAARAAADRLNAAHGQHGRRAAIYAIGADGIATIVPDHYRQPET